MTNGGEKVSHVHSSLSAMADHIPGQTAQSQSTSSAPTEEEYGMGRGEDVEGQGAAYEYGMGTGRVETAQHDSTMGELEEEAGKLLHDKRLHERGEEKRREAGAFKDTGKH